MKKNAKMQVVFHNISIFMPFQNDYAKQFCEKNCQCAKNKEKFDHIYVIFLRNKQETLSPCTF